MSDLARPSWPENQQPTPEQWRDWFLACGPDSQRAVAERVLENGEMAYRCFLRNHHGLEVEADHLRRRAHRLHLAWRSARRYRWASRKVLAGWTPDDAGGRP